MTSLSNQLARRLILLTLMMGTALLYARVGQFEFTIYDDDQYVAKNVDVSAGLTWSGIKLAFTGTLMGNWHPLTLLSHMLDCTLFGLSSGAHHLVNLAFHIANACLLFLWLEQTTGARWRSAVVAALFAWHPLHVESVAWVAERKDVLSTCFGLLTLLAYGQYVRGARGQGAGGTNGTPPRLTTHATRWYLISLALFACGLMSKPMLVTLPCVLLLLDYWPLGRMSAVSGHSTVIRVNRADWGRLILEKLPFLLLALAQCFITFVVQQNWGAMSHLQELSLRDRMGNAVVAYARYLGKTFWPVDLAVHYPHPGSWPMGVVLAAALLLLAITVLAVTLVRRQPWLLVGWLWFLGVLVPAIGVVQVGTQSMADRYTYLPHIGLFIAIVWPGATWLGRTPVARVIGWAGIAAALLACAGLTWRQIGHWRNSVTLFANAVEATPQNPLAHYNYAVSVGHAGQEELMLQHYEETLRLDPDYFSANVNLGHHRYHAGRIAEATNLLLHAVQLIPTNAVANYWCGRALESAGDLPGARKCLAAAVAGETNSADYRVAYARVLQASGEIQAAIEQLLPALQFGEQLGEVHARLGALLLLQGNPTEAASHYRASLVQAPDSVEVLNNLAWLLATHPQATVRDGRQATELAKRACELTGGNEPQLLGTLAAAQAEAGDFSEAQVTAAKAIELAQAAGKPELAERNRELLDYYRTGKPYRTKP